MKSSPLTILPTLVLVLAILAGVVTWVTRTPHTAETVVATDNTATASAPDNVRVCNLVIETSAPVALTIQIPPNEPLDVDLSGGRTQMAFSLPSLGADILLNAKFQTKKRSALRVVVTENQETVSDQTFWSETTLAEAIPVPARAVSTAPVNP